NCGLAATATATAKAEISAEKMALRAVPNPFGARTDIGFTLTQDGSYKLEVLDMRGTVVTVLAQGNGRAGEHKVYQFEKGRLSNGTYIARLVTDEGVSFIRIVTQKECVFNYPNEAGPEIGVTRPFLFYVYRIPGSYSHRP